MRRRRGSLFAVRASTAGCGYAYDRVRQERGRHTCDRKEGGTAPVLGMCTQAAMRRGHAPSAGTGDPDCHGPAGLAMTGRMVDRHTQALRRAASSRIAMAFNEIASYIVIARRRGAAAADVAIRYSYLYSPRIIPDKDSPRLNQWRGESSSEWAVAIGPRPRRVARGIVVRVGGSYWPPAPPGGAGNRRQSGRQLMAPAPPGGR